MGYQIDKFAGLIVLQMLAEIDNIGEASRISQQWPLLSVFCRFT